MAFSRDLLNTFIIESRLESNVLSKRSESKDFMFYLYILRNSANQLHISQTNDLPRRLQEHATGTHGAKFIKGHGNFSHVYQENFQTRAEAMKREKQLKGWTRAKKEALTAGNLLLLKKL